ncbi:HD domain-containing protein [Stutzerimonas stutzeri]
MHLTNAIKRPALLWAERISVDEVSSSWRFAAGGREFFQSVSSDRMQQCNAEGQWIVAELGAQQNQWQLRNVRPLPGRIGRSQLEQQLAWVDCTLRDHLADIWSMLAYIDDEALAAFMLSVLADPDIMMPFCLCKASHRHHHDHAGGLLAHSYEVARTAAMLCSQYQLGIRAASVAFVGGLFHDIGKIRLFYNDAAGICGQHEAYTFMVLAGPLEQLRKQSPKLFEALSACFAVRVGKCADPYQVADVVRMCDRLSADVFNWKSAFDRLPHYYWYGKSDLDGRLCKRLG